MNRRFTCHNGGPPSAAEVVRMFKELYAKLSEG
jgi:hypothetical protein